MVRSYHTLACTLLGMMLVLLVERNFEFYAVLGLGLAIPWDRLAEMTGDLAGQYVEWRRKQIDQKELEATWR